MSAMTKKIATINGITAEYEDFVLPNGQYFSELTTLEQEELLRWVERVAIPAFKKLTKVCRPIPTLECLRCGHTWYPRTNRLPKVCPNRKCKSPYWNKPRKKGR